jgi:hypothetical protein
LDIGDWMTGGKNVISDVVRSHPTCCMMLEQGP